MCQELCQNISSERFHCKHISGNGKKVIFFNRDADTKLVLKTKSLKPSELELEHVSLLRDSMMHETLASTVLFLRRITSDLFASNDTFDRFLSHIDLDKPSAIASVASGESLLSQEEYVALNNLQSTGIVPTLHGTCGNFYVVDYLPTDSALLVNSLSAGWPWNSVGKHRFELSLQCC